MPKVFGKVTLALLMFSIFIPSGQAQSGQINDLLKAGYEIKGATSNPQMVIILQKGELVMLCFLNHLENERFRTGCEKLN